MEPTTQGGAAATPARQVTVGEVEALYVAEYPKLVRFLIVLGATLQEAEDAVQKAMADFARRLMAGEAIGHPAAYVRKGTVRFFVKERERDREREGRHISGGYRPSDPRLDDHLTAWEDEQWVDHVLASLTPAQRDVIKLVMDGASAREVAEELGKTEPTVRQHLKNGRDRLLQHPEIAARAPRERQAREKATSAVAPARRTEEVQ